MELKRVGINALKKFRMELKWVIYKFRKLEESENSGKLERKP